MNMIDEKISIIIPVYQAEKYLAKCLMTVRQQSYPNLEIILVDDGSTDLSGKICDEVSEKDNRIVVVHQKNQGVSSARNAGLDLCTGTYVMFVDADDWMEVDCCECVIKRMAREDADICFFEMHIEKELPEKTTALDDYFIDNLVDTKKKLMKATIPFKNGDSEQNMVFYGPYCKVFKREIIGDIRFLLGLKYGEDALFNLQVILAAKSFCFEENPFYHYRKNNASVTSSFKEDRVEQSILRLQYTEQVIMDNNLDYLNDEFIQMFINIVFWLITNLLSGRKKEIRSAWSIFRRITDNREMQAVWNRIQGRGEHINLFDAMFSENKLLSFLAFCRLRYIK